MKKILIVGGVAGGATAAARLRRLNEEDEIIIFERGEYISFANCGLPYYIGNVISDRNKLLVQTIEGMSKRFNLDIRNFSEVIDVDRENKTVKVRNVKTGETYTENYDILILSPGAKPLKPKIDGIDEADNLFVLRNIPDADDIKKFIEENKPNRAVVIGGGFIGIEMAENLALRGIKVTIVEKLNQVLPPLDFEMAQIVHQEINTNGVDLILEDGIAGFKDRGRKIVLESGKEIDTDMTILSIGVAPDLPCSENPLAKSCGLALGKKGHIVTTKQLQTIDAKTGQVVEDIYAIGDVAQITDYVTGDETAIPLAGPANRQGRLAADHINGIDVNYPGALASSVLKVFNLTVASTGNNERQLKTKGLKYKAVHAHPANHATYYPGSSQIAMKLLFDPDSGKIYGAQAVGREGTEKRIDVIATTIKLGGTIRDLQGLELCYAPPYSSAKDPVNMLGYIACNVADGVYDMVYWNEIDDIVKNGGYLLDVRTPLEFGAGHIEGAVNIELDELRNRIDEIPVSKDTPIYVNCQVGLRAYLAIRILQANGFKKIYNLSGGYLTYKEAKYKIQNSSNAISDTPFEDKKQEVSPPSTPQIIKEIDARGLQCPGPLLAVYNALKDAKEGDQIRVTATDYGFAADIENWCNTNGHKLISLTRDNGKYTALIQKGDKESRCAFPSSAPPQENATIVLFSGNLDKTLAAMIIAQGAAMQGKNVTVFSTFWGLNALRKDKPVKVKKNFIEKMFGFMMPRGASKMPLSNMNMLGIGPAMIKSLMKSKNVNDIDTMIKSAMDLGVKFVACTMSMDLMGIKQEELIDGVELGGVATYVSRSENAGITLFI